MGAVYKGRQISLDREVAIKILSAALAGDDMGFAERFKNEARAMAKLKHPGIVDVYESGETSDGLLYIVMEFIEGTDVARMIAKNGRLHSEHAMAITAHVCDALAYAHQRGIIHRDIKPANIMVSYEGVVKVADFGLAKMSHGQTTGLTQSGMAMGTLYYMAPEALMLGSAVDQRADIYAVGVMLYQMLTGKLPQGLFELPSLQIPGLDPRYDGIIGKALREDRELRYPSALDMRHDLDAILTQPVVRVEAAAEKAPAALSTQARPQRPDGRPYRPPAASLPRPAPAKGSSGGMLAVVVLLVVAVAAFLYFRGNDRVDAVESVPAAPHAGDWIDLLPLADPKADAVSGRWTRVADGLQGEIISGTKGAQVLQLPYEPPEEYDFRIAYTTLEGNREASQILSAFGSQFTWGTASGQPDKWSGFNMVNGKPMMQSGAGVKLPGQRDMNRRYESLVEVRRDRVTGYVDGEKLVEWKTNYSDLSMDPGHAIPNPRALGIAIWWSKTVFHEVSVREVTGKGKRLREPDVASVTTTVKAAPSPAEPAQAAKEVPFVNSLGMKFVPVPGTNILMCVHETRRKDYMAYLAANPSVKSTLKSLQRDGTDIGSTDMHPACNLAWDEMQAFCAWLSKKDGRTFRLPTDREWSWAVGIGDKEESGRLPSELAAGLRGVYPWGTTWPPPPGSGNFSDASAAELLKTEAIPGYQDGFGGLAPVMSFPPNALGIHDLAGNVWEWCSDWYDASRQTYVLRGGCYRDGGVDKGNCLRSADRISRTPNGRSASDGFRLVMEEKLVTATPAAITSAPVRAAKQGPVGVAASPPAAVTQPTGPTTWTDTKGRSITATFKTIASGNVLLDIAGKVTPVPLNTLSAESQKLARAYQQQAASTSSPDTATKDRPFLNTLGMKFVPVPGTDFLMCIHETRKQDYATYAREAPGVNDNWTHATSFGIPTSTGDDHPVVSISWQEAQAFAQWLSQKEGRTYRLPTDREWSQAIGIANLEPAGQTPENLVRLGLRVPGWTGTPPPDSGNYSDETLASTVPNRDYIRGYTDGYVTTAPVMSFKPNALGIYDLLGNPWEYCEDWYDAAQTQRTVRGACYNDAVISPLARASRVPTLRHESTGFRLVLQLAATSAKAPAASASVLTPSAPNAATTATATKDKPFTNSLGMKFVPVTRTKVLFCIHETRKQDYAAYAAANPGLPSDWLRPEERGIPLSTADDHPVVSISWEEARSFCVWLGRKEGLTYRLPTDHEWSAAVGIADNEPSGKTPEQLKLLQMNSGEFPWGRTWPPPKGTGNFSDITASQVFPPEALASSIDGYSDGFAGTAPVMSFKPNRFGLFDLGGNVYEMCEDWFNAGQRDRVVRGHSWSGGTPLALLSSNRGTCTPNARINRHGFRVVLELPQP